MLYLLFDAGADTYAVASGAVEGVVPYGLLKQVPGAGPAVAGLLNYHGQPFPILDCGELLAGRPCEPKSGTRIALCRVPLGGTVRLVGLLGENVTRVHSFAESDFQPPSLRAGCPECVGAVTAWNGQLIQRIAPERAIRADVLGALLAGAEL